MSRFQDIRACHSKLAGFSTLWWCDKYSCIKYFSTLLSIYRSLLNSLKKGSHCPSFSCVISLCEMLNSVSAYRDGRFVPFPGQFFEERFRFNVSENAGCAICAFDVNANVSENVKKAVHKNEERIRRSVYCNMFSFFYVLPSISYISPPFPKVRVQA